MYATHQTAKYSSDPRTSHGEAVLYLICYLKKTCDFGLLFKPDPNKDFEYYCDADFSGLCNKTFAPSHEVVGSSSMQAALSLGPPNFNLKLHSTPPQLSTLQCHKL
jgi:hypothetical protein